MDKEAEKWANFSDEESWEDSESTLFLKTTMGSKNNKFKTEWIRQYWGKAQTLHQVDKLIKTCEFFLDDIDEDLLIRPCEDCNTIACTVGKLDNEAAREAMTPPHKRHIKKLNQKKAIKLMRLDTDNVVHWNSPIKESSVLWEIKAGHFVFNKKDFFEANH